MSATIVAVAVAVVVALAVADVAVAAVVAVILDISHEGHIFLHYADWLSLG